MKIYASNRSPETANVYKVIDAMDWNKPTFMNKGKDGYICKWGGISLKQRELDDCMQAYFEDNYDIDIGTYSPTVTVSVSRIAKGLNISAKEARSIYDKVYKECSEFAEYEMQNMLKEIKTKTGIDCKLTPSGNLVIPYAE